MRNKGVFLKNMASAIGYGSGQLIGYSRDDPGFSYFPRGPGGQFRRADIKKRSGTEIPDRLLPKIGRSDYSCAIASAGQPATQAPQSMQVPASTDAVPSFMAMAPTGQVPTHASHPTHCDASTFAAIIHSSFFPLCGIPQTVKYTLNAESSSRKAEIFRFFLPGRQPGAPLLSYGRFTNGRLRESG